MAAKKRLGTLGAGGHGRLSHFAIHDGAELVAAYDPSPASLAETVAAVGHEVAVCRRSEDLVERDDVDAVLVMAPDEAHPELLELAVRAGKPVLCEKPLAIDWPGVAKVSGVLERAESQGLLVASCHPRRNQDSDLPYGWVKANLAGLEDRYGQVRRIGLNSMYPWPGAAWKQQRSFLMDKFVHDIDYVRYLLGDLPFAAERLVDGPAHYEVEGTVEGLREPVALHCQGTRLHGARGEFIETITLHFDLASLVVYTKTGVVRLRERMGSSVEVTEITPMRPESYTRVFAKLMAEFIGALDGGPRAHTMRDLQVVTESAVALAATAGWYEYC